jgi:putative tryptophan/tyrosine transport system substrate-binding protein
MRRRDFIKVAFGFAAARPFVARADEQRRVGVLMNRAAGDAEGQTAVAAFRQALQELGWSEGRNLQIDIRWGENDVDRERRYAAELVALAPELILAPGTLSVASIRNINRTLPIVFVTVSDPVGAGFVDSLARPGGNTTGFMLLEYGSSGKWLDLLKQITPRLARAAVLRDPSNPAAAAEFGAIQAVAQAVAVEVIPVSVRDAAEIERGISAFSRSANGGLIVLPSAGVSAHIDLIIALATRHKLPAVYSNSANVARGGLISYGPVRLDQFRRAASYVDRILKGEKPADLPVQAPTKHELVINLKTAKALGLTIPPTLLATADEVIE